MSVFDDPKKELAALQAQLEAQEEWFQQELDSAKRMIGEAPRQVRPTSAGAGVPQSGKKTAAARTSAPRKAPAEEKPKKKGIKGLVILALLELLGIAGIAAYWLLFLL